MVLGEEDGPVKLTSSRKLTTEDTPNAGLQASTSVPAGGSDDALAEKSIAADSPSPQASLEPAHNKSTGEGEDRGRDVGEDRDDEETTRQKGHGKSSLQQLRRPDSLEIDDQLSPKRERKSVLRKRDPTPVHTGPTYTSTSPVGEPFDSSGQKRSGTRVGRECCSLM